MASPLVRMESDSATVTTDSLPFTFSSKLLLSNSSSPNLSTADDVAYDMSGHRLALIFNHTRYCPHLGLTDRSGSHHDVKAIKDTFAKLNFTCMEYNDLKRDEMENVVKELDYYPIDVGVVVIFILTHGDTDGILFAKDNKYVLRAFILPTLHECPALRLRPKLIFIQACKGTKVDNGIRLSRTTYDSVPDNEYRQPITADTLIFESSVEGFFSFRNEGSGSWFIQTLCKTIDDSHTDQELNEILLKVKNKVGTQYVSHSPQQPNTHRKLQMPNITFNSLLKKIFLKANLNASGRVENEDLEQGVSDPNKCGTSGCVSEEEKGRESRIAKARKSAQNGLKMLKNLPIKFCKFTK